MNMNDHASKAPRPPTSQSESDEWLHTPTLVVAMVALMVLALGAPLVLMACVAALLYVLMGPRQALQALAIMVIIKYLNFSIYDFPSLFGVLAWAILLLVAVRAALKLRLNIVRELLPLWFLVLIVAVLTPINSASPVVSGLKLTSFALGVTGVIATSLSLSSEGARFLRKWLPSVALAVALISVLTIPFPGISQRTVAGSFQGIMSQPQSFGTFLAPLLTLMAGRLVFQRQRQRQRQRNRWIDWAALAVVAWLLLWSRARTAFLAVILGLMTTFLIGLLGNAQIRKFALRGFLFALGLGLVALVAISTNNSVRNAAHEFIFKRGDGSTVEESFMRSRGHGVISQWDNFLREPLTGNGFGIFPGGVLSANATTFMGLPISAPVEKGFLPSAVLEENGVVGTIAFIILIVALVRRTLNTHDVVWTSVLLTCLFVNLGEAVFFSVGGIGLYFWLWIGLAIRGTSPLQGEFRKGGSVEWPRAQSRPGDSGAW